MLETILITLIVAKIKGYSIKPLFKSWTIYPVIFFECIYLGIQILIFNQNYEAIKYVGLLKTLYLSSYLCMILKYQQYNAALVGSGCILMGTVLNNIAIAVNGGMMPVFPSLSYITGYASVEAFETINDIHILGDVNTRLKILTDIIDLGYSILSIGDVLIRVFVFIIIFCTIRTLNTKEI